MNERKLLAEMAEAELCRRSFIRFLTHVKVRSDDPLNPIVTNWEPWDYLIEQALGWAAGGSEVILKDRQLGYSWLAAAYAVWRARNGAAVALISKGQLEARELLSKCVFVEAHLPKHLQARASVKVDDLKFPGDGFIMAFPSTPDAGVSFTFQVVIMDEAHFHPHAAMNYTAIRPTISAGGQFICLSTADPSMGPYGWFPDMYWASKKGETGYLARFIPWNARPGRDRAWYEREKQAYNGMSEAFDAYYADTDAQAFVGRTGLVYPQFDTARHVRAPRVPLTQCIRVVAGVDFGGGDPTAVVILGMDSRHHIHQYHEFYKRGAVGIDQIAGFLGRFPVGRVVCDPSESVAIETLRQTGLDAVAAMNKRGEGLNQVAFLLDADKLTIDPTNKDSIAEFPGYRWQERTDPNDKSRYQTKTTVDHHADAMDARRYACVELMAMLRPSTQMPSRATNGTRLATRAV